MITLDGSHIPLAVMLNFEAINNMVEYEAYIARKEALREFGVKEVATFRDSTLVITQTQKLKKVKKGGQNVNGFSLTTFNQKR